MANFIKSNAVRVYAVLVALVALAAYYVPNLPVDLILAVAAAAIGEPVHRVATASAPGASGDAASTTQTG